MMYLGRVRIGTGDVATCTISHPCFHCWCSTYHHEIIMMTPHA
jgi:hypothetical protein